MSFCTNCGQPIPAGGDFCPNCGTQNSAKPQSVVSAVASENELDVVGGRLSFDSDALTFHRDSQKMVNDMPGIFKAAAKLSSAVVGNMETNQVIPLGLIDSVELTWFQAGLLGKIPISGELLANAAGGVRVFTASGGPRSEQGFSFYKGQEENAQRFVNALKLACTNRGRKVELVSGAAPVASEDTKVCPDCAEGVKSAARVCRFCGYQFA